jgi:hypothetical protein
MSYVTKLQNIYDARVTEPRLPAPMDPMFSALPLKARRAFRWAILAL